MTSTENEYYKKMIENAIEKAGIVVDSYVDKYEKLECIQYDTYRKRVCKQDCLRMKNDVMKTYSLTFGRPDGVPYSSIIALVHNGKVIYQNDSIVTKYLSDIKDSAKTSMWNQKILNARDAITGRIDINAVLNNRSIVQKQKQKTNDVTMHFTPGSVKTGLTDKNYGEYSSLTLPKGVIVNNIDYGNCRILIRSRVTVGDKKVSVSFNRDAELKLVRDHEVVGSVRAEELAKGLHDLYHKMDLDMQKEQEPDNTEDMDMGR